jgi:hypothetical protein
MSSLSAADQEMLDQLNRLSLSRSFTPQVDIDWSATTTEPEFAALFSVTSLFAGTRFESAFSTSGRAQFIRYQQMNLMLFTAQLERHGIAALARMYDDDDSQPFTEYLGNFLKEEIYHYTMFTRAIEQIQITLPDLPRLPARRIDLSMRLLFILINLLPGKKLRANLAFRFFQFAEQLTLFINQTVRQEIPRREGFINQIWSYHALDEARHLAFDRMMLERNRLIRPLAWLTTAASGFCCVLLAALVNSNEIWAAQQLGVPARLRHLPELLRTTRAPLKHRIFLYLRTMLKGGRATETEESL